MPKVPNINSRTELIEIKAFILTRSTPEGLSSKQKIRLKEKSENFIVENGKLLYVSGTEKLEYIGDFRISKTKQIIEECHLPGHIGKEAIRKVLCKKYVGISIKAIKNYVNSCQSCQRETLPSPETPLTPIIPSFIRERLIIDTIDLSEYEETNGGYKYVFTMIDSFSKFAFCFPSKRKDAASFLKCFEKLFYNEGRWRIVHSDNGGEFTAGIVKDFMAKINSVQIHGAPYRPQTQGQIERFNRTLKSRLRKNLLENNRNWIESLDKIVYQYNTTNHRAINTTPFILFKGYDPTDMNFHLNEKYFELQESRNFYLRYVEGFKKAYDERINSQQLEVLDKVIIAKEFNGTFRRRPGALESYYENGLYIVNNIFGSTVHLFEDQNEDNKLIVHISLLKKIS